MTLAQAVNTADLTATQLAVREHFQEGGSPTTVVSVLALIMVGFGFAYLLSRRFPPKGQETIIDDPARLFRDVITELKLSVPNRRFLLTMARDLRLEHPSAVLLSPMLFDRCLSRWEKAKTRPKELTDAARETREELFADHTNSE